MKRFVIVIIMLTGILGAGCFSLFRLKNIVDQMETELSSLSELVEQKQGQDLQQKIQDFQRLWEDEERVMMRYIHHDELDTITGTVARLFPLAEYENHAELAAEISQNCLPSKAFFSRLFTGSTRAGLACLKRQITLLLFHSGRFESFQKI